MPKISVVIPAYNIELYLDQTIKSVLSQTLNDIEVLIIDDGSSDCSLKIAKISAKEDRRVRVIQHEYNRGLSATRNTGIKNSKGNFITFLDGDDKLASRKVLEKLYQKIKAHNSDIIRSQLSYFVEKNQRIIEDLQGLRDFGVPIYNTDIVNYPRLHNHKTSWLFTYRKKFLLENNIQFNESLKRREDMAFVYDCLFRSRRVSICNVVSHLYRKRQAGNSIVDNPKFEDFLFFIKQVEYVFTIKNNDNLAFNKEELIAIYNGICARYIGAIDKIWIPASNNFTEKEKSVFIDELIKTFSLFDFSNHSFEEWSFLDAIESNKLRAGYYDLFVSYISSKNSDKLLNLFYKEPNTSDLLSFCQENHSSKIVLKKIEKKLLGKLNKNDQNKSKNFPSAPIRFNKIQIFIHIGSTKAGSTSIQNWLFDNRFPNLHNRGIYFPYTGITFDPTRNERMSGHHRFFLSLLENGSLLENFYNELRGLKEIPKKIIFSCENLSYDERWLEIENIKLIKKAFSSFNIKIIYYVRPQHEWINSMYGEAVAGGWQKYNRSPLDFYLREHLNKKTDYYNIALNWRKVFGYNNIFVEIFNNDLFKEGIINSILNIVGEKNIRESYKPSNVSLGYSFISTVLATNQFDIPLDLHQKFIAEFENIYKQKKFLDEKKWFFSGSQLDMIINDNKKTNELLEKEFLKEKKIIKNEELNCVKNINRLNKNIDEDILLCGMKIYYKHFQYNYNEIKNTKEKIENIQNKASKIKIYNESLNRYKFGPLINLIIKIENYLRLRKQVFIIKRSKLFDENWYKNKYLKFEKGTIHPIVDYLLQGVQKGRNPSENFDTASYLENRPDVKMNGMNPLIHYILHARKGD